MALCLTHGAAGYLAYEAARPAGPHRPVLLAAAVVLANAADLDFLPGVLLGRPAEFHRGISHTVLAAVVVAAGAALAVRSAGRPRPVWRRAGWWAGAVYGSHLLLDFFTTNVVPPHGARFLWPLTARYYIAPVTPLPEIVIDPSGRGAFLASLVAPPSWPVWAHELAVLVLAVGIVHVVRAWQPRPALCDVPEEL